MEYKSIPLPPFDLQYKEHEEKAVNRDYCYLCGKAIANPKSVWMIHVVGGGSAVSNIPEATDDPGDMYFFPIGPMCYKKNPSLIGFAWKAEAIPMKKRSIIAFTTNSVNKTLTNAGFAKVVYGRRVVRGWDNDTEGFISIKVDDYIRVTWHPASAWDGDIEGKNAMSVVMLAKYKAALEPHFSVQHQSIPSVKDYTSAYLAVRLKPSVMEENNAPNNGTPSGVDGD